MKMILAAAALVISGAAHAQTYTTTIAPDLSKTVTTGPGGTMTTTTTRGFDGTRSVTTYAPARPGYQPMGPSGYKPTGGYKPMGGP